MILACLPPQPVYVRDDGHQIAQPSPLCGPRPRDARRRSVQLAVLHRPWRQAI